MWLSKREEQEKKGPDHALTGPVTLAGNEVGAWLEGERRGVAVYAPGGYHWSPQVGDQVLVLKAGERGEQPCAVGVAQSGGLSPGEILIEAGEASIRMTPDGNIALTGVFTVNGMMVGPYPLPKGDEGEEGTADGASVS